MVINRSIQHRITNTYYTECDTYESQDGHGIKEDEKDLWVADILSAATISIDSKVLDIGCGTGVFSRFLLDFGCEIVGLDASEPMIKEAKKLLPPQLQNKAHFLVGDTHQSDIFPSMTFDWIVARQAVCHFYDPLVTFENWRRWLKPEGRILIVEGLWLREHWGDNDLVDLLPLSCHQSRAAIAYLLEKAGFQIDANQWLTELNSHLRNNNKSDVLRYAIVARKTKMIYKF